MENLEDPCSYYEDLLQASMDSGGSQPMPPELSLHLETCDACRDAQREYEALDTMAREFIPLVAPADLLSGIMEQLTPGADERRIANHLAAVLTALKRAVPRLGLGAISVILVISLYCLGARESSSYVLWSTGTGYMSDFVTTTLSGITGVLNGISSYLQQGSLIFLAEMSGLEKHIAPSRGPAGLAWCYSLAVLVCLVLINYGLISQVKRGGQSSWGT